MNNLLTRYFRLLGYLLVLAVLTQLISPAPKANATQTTYKVGDTTKTGGTVFYVLPPETQSSWHYLEVAPNNWDSGKLVSTSYKKAESYVYTYKDKSWFIPSADDFATLYTEYKAKHLRGNIIQPGRYWTSTGAVDPTTNKISSLQVFSTSTRKTTAQSYTNATNGKILLRVRPIRYFD